MQSARTKQLIILGNRKNRTNDLLRELSAQRARESDASTPGRTSGRLAQAGALETKHWARMQKRLKSVQSKVDTGLRRNKAKKSTKHESRPKLAVRVATSEDGQSSSVPEKNTRKPPPRIVVEDADESDSEEDMTLPPRLRIRRKCGRDARKALTTLRKKPLSPMSTQHFRDALENFLSQRTLVQPLLQISRGSKENDIGQPKASDELEVTIDRLEESYDPHEQLGEEFVSVWGAVAHESKDLLRREPVGTSMKTLGKHLFEHYAAIRNIFKYYSSMTKPFDENITAAELGSMTLADWMTFCRDCKLIGPHPKHQLVKSSAELLFIRLNWVTDDNGRKVKNQDASNSDRSLIMPEFLCGILRLAKQCGERMDNLAHTSAKFIREVVCERANSVDVEKFRMRMRFHRAQAAIRDYETEIKAAFVKYAAAEVNDRIGAGLTTMDLKELMSLCRRLGIVASTDEDRHLLAPLVVQQLFALSQLQVVGEDAGEIDEDEFVELISRIAEAFFNCHFTAASVAEDDRFQLHHELGEQSPRASLLLRLGPGPRDALEANLAFKLRWFFPRLSMILKNQT